MAGKPKVVVFGMDSISYELLRRFAKEGVLPNIARLFRVGASGPAMPCLPAYTPTNWATLATGAYPGTHGAGNWSDRAPTDPPGRTPLSTFDSRAIAAETIWEAAERAGLKSLVAAYPGSYPSRLMKGFVITPLHRGLVSLVVIPGAEYSTQKRRGAVHLTLREAQGWKNAPRRKALETKLIVASPSLLQAALGEAAKAVGDTEDGADLEVAVKRVAGKGGAPEAVVLNVLVLNSRGRGFDRVLISETKDAAKAFARLKLGEWSDWLIRRLKVENKAQPVSMRFKLLDLSPDGKRLRIARSEVYPTRNFTSPSSLSRELVENVGPYFEHASLPGGRNFENYKQCIYEEIEYQVDWHVRAADYVMRTRGWDIYYIHWHFPDSVCHSCLAGADPESPAYDPKIAKECMHVLRQACILGDRMVKGLWKVGGKNCYMVLVSDHGNSTNKFVCSLERRLVETGLARFAQASGGKRKGLDISRSRAYPHGGAQVCVNLKGRERHGIVKPSDYEKVQEEIIDALLDWKDPRTGKRAVALALKKKDAPLIGYWGERTGDVFFIYNSGFAWGNPGGEASIAVAPLGANHGPQIPTTWTDLSSVMAAFAIAGPGIRKGYARDPERMGYFNLVDVVPTLCHLLGIRPPAQSQGSVMHDILK